MSRCNRRSGAFSFSLLFWLTPLLFALTCVQAAAQSETKYTYDSLGRLRVETRVGSSETTYKYDKAGNALLVNTYDPNGVPASTNSTRFAYTGQITIPGLTGLYHYKARVYNPALGRFLQTDPIGYKDDMDLYTYVGNDPLNQTGRTQI